MEATTNITIDRLVQACADDAHDGGIAISAELEPLAGPGAPVKPAVYEGGTYQHDVRWRGEGHDRATVPAIIIDNVPSQANRLEDALRRHRRALGLPELVLDLTGLTDLPVHLPRTISSFSMPHRNADAYLRDATIEGTGFLKSDLGRAIFSATSDRPDALLDWMPQALIYGFWQSHLGKKGPQSKLARSWVSEIVGYEPAADDIMVKGVKGDPLNLPNDFRVSYDDTNPTQWVLLEASGSGKASKGEKISEIGHGQVLVGGSPAGVSFAAIEQHASLNFAGLRRIHLAPEGRALLAAVALAAHALAFGHAFSLRSGCELLTRARQWCWRGATADEAIAPLDPESAIDLVASAADLARGAGYELSGWRHEPIYLLPNESLAKLITGAYPASEAL